MTDKVKTATGETAREQTPRVVRPRIGDRVEQTRQGIQARGTVHYVDELQILVKWDNGRSESVRSAHADRLRILTADDT